MISVIIPMYNAATKIHILLDSLLQSKADFEIICVNDGSKDNTVEVVSNYKDERIKLFSKENGGTFRAWQYGLSKSSGEYVTILDQDDYIDSDYLEYIRIFMEKFAADVLFTPYYIEKEDGSKYFEKLPFEEGIYASEKLESIREKLVSGAVPYAKFTKVIKKSVLESQVKETYQGAIHDFEDWLTMIEIFSKIDSLYISNRPFYHYIQYNNSVSRSNISYRKNFESLKNMLSYLETSNYSNLREDIIMSIQFYGYRCILNKCTKIREISLMKEILGNSNFQSMIKKANISNLEKLLLCFRNPYLYYSCYRLKTKWRKNR